MLENIIVIAAVAAALVYVIGRFIRKGKGEGSCSCSGCSSCPSSNCHEGCSPH